MTGPSKPPRRLLLLIFLSSLSCLAYELALIRIFSITLWYHFAFMVISIAMLGIGASGTMLAVAPALRDLRRVPMYGLLLGFGLPLSYLLANAVPFDPAKLSWDPLQVLNIGLYYLVLSGPFFCFGLIVSTTFSTLQEYPGSIYASDLLGAGTGSFLMFWLLSRGGPEQSVFLVSLLISTGLLFLARGAVRQAALLLLALDVAVLALQPQFIEPRMSPYKPLPVALQFPGAEHLKTYTSPYARVDLFKSPAVRFAPGLSLRYLAPLPAQTGLAVDGGDIHAITDVSDKAGLRFLRFLPSSLPYLLARRDDVLVLDPKGGLALLVAEQHGAIRITGIESNPLTMKAIAEHRDTASDDRTPPELHAGLGRAWLDNQLRIFDIIDLSFLGSLPAASFGFAEDYRFTVEAFRTYLAHLKPDGFFSLNLYILPPPRTELRLLATLVAAAEASGIRDASSRIAAIRSWGTVTILYKNGALSGEDIGRIRSFCRKMRFDAVYYPGIIPEESNVYVKMPRNEYFTAFERLLDPEQRQQFMQSSMFDIRPVHDDSPFFQYYLRFGNIGAIYRLMGGKWQFFFEEGYLLPVLFAQVLVISFILIVLPLFTTARSAPLSAARGAPSALVYFGAIGLGFLFIETVLIQKMVLILEHPAYAAGTVIASLLAGAGAGSFASQKKEHLRRPPVLLAVACLGAGYGLLLPGIAALLGGLTLPFKAGVIFLSFLPLGFFMGMPLPLGMALLQERAPVLIPWAWAINGCFSVLSPVLAVMIALSTGYDTVILCGAGLYAAGFVMIRRRDGQRAGSIAAT
jgi:hypothetical protein